jgi:hypothetical protein
MVTLLSVQDSPSVVLDPEVVHCCETCRMQMEAAKREMGAYATAVHELFGKTEAGRAAEDWIEAAESVASPFIDAYPNWRQVTVAAASKLSIRRIQAQNTHEITGEKGDE